MVGEFIVDKLTERCNILHMEKIYEMLEHTTDDQFNIICELAQWISDVEHTCCLKDKIDDLNRAILKQAEIRVRHIT